MAIETLLLQLCQLEQELLLTATRRNARRWDELLHPDFEEIGRSGRRYDRAEIMREFSSGEDLGRIRAENFSVSEISDGTALLRYESAHVDEAGHLYRPTLRSSLWVRTTSGWQLRFHQGTPADTLR